MPRLAARIFALLVGLTCVGCPKTWPCKRVVDLEHEPPPVQSYPSALSPGRLAILGDLQRTSWGECAIGREVNDREQRLLLAELTRRAPENIAIVGDLVFDGSSSTHWHYFDWLMRAERRRGTSVIAAMGNHEYWGDDDDALAEVRTRFPVLRKNTWYTTRWGQAALVVVDTNHGEIASKWASQRAWYEETMAALEREGDVRAIFVLAHHPPFTNSPIVPPHEPTMEAFVPAFCASTKARILFSGHAHGYERFVRGPEAGCGTTPHQFIITGGGGGPRPRTLRSSTETGLVDALPHPAPRPFNFVLLDQHPDGIDIDVVGLDKGQNTFRRVESQRLSWAR